MQFILPLLFFLQAFGYQNSLKSSGEELFWSDPKIPVSLVNTTNDLDSNLINEIILNSFSEWNIVSSSVSIFPASSSQNQIKFLKNFPYGSAVLGVTEVSYNNSGAIQKAMIYLNDDYTFKSSPGLYMYKEIYLGDVLTHELGHLLGLSHSEVLDSTMFFSSFSGQSTIAADDSSGIRSKYDQGYGSISGFVKGGRSVGILGAHIQAISRMTGKAMGGLSDENGFFQIEGLDLNDTYYLYVSPLKDSNSLPQYYANSQNEFCPGSYVGSFFSACGRENDGKPTGITLTENDPLVEVGTISISCSLRSDLEYDEMKNKNDFDPITIFDFGLENKYEKSFVGWFRKPAPTTWSVKDKLIIDLTEFDETVEAERYLGIKFISYPFGNLAEYEMSLYRSGTSNAIVTKNLSYSNETETYFTDFSIDLPLDSNPALNKYEIHLKSKKLLVAAETFPYLNMFTSETYMPYLIVASLNSYDGLAYHALSGSEAKLSDNESCLDAPFSYSVAKSLSGGSGGSGFAQSSQTINSAASCGSIDSKDGQNFPGNTLLLTALGFFIVYLISSHRKRRKNILS